MKRIKKKTLTLIHTPLKGSVSLVITHPNYLNTFPQHLVIIFQLTRTSCTAALPPPRATADVSIRRAELHI